MKITSLLIVAVSLLLVGGVVWWEWDQKTSPGPLNPTHERVARLRGTGGCEKCHGPDANAMAAACLSCHEDVKRQIDTAHGVHGTVEKTAALACGSCHAEHAGSGVRLVSDRSFQAAGFADPEHFDHRKVCKFVLIGGHSSLRCEQCHKNARADLLSNGQTRFTGLSQQCVSCHNDPHHGTNGADCASCHGQTVAFKKAPDFHHTDRFKLVEAHAIADCRRCHAATGPTSVVALRAGPFVVRACTACHNDPHRGSYGQDCASCHGMKDPFDQVPSFKHTKAFPLAGGHRGLACRQCHATSGPHSVASLKLSPTPVRTCAECHQSPHRKTLIAMVSTVTHRSESETCTVCHLGGQRTFLSPVANMTAQLHRGTGFPLDRPHDRLECVACHKGMGERKPIARNVVPAAQFQKIFPGRTPEQCGECHRDPHAGQFNSGPTLGQCVACHALTHFSPNSFGVAQHQKTHFPLTGAHKAVACSTCHQKHDGLVRFVGTSTTCSDCHADVHGGKFDKLALGGKIGGGCERCHNTSSFFNVSWTARDHVTLTGFALKGAHATASCTDCHKPHQQAGARKAAWGAAPRTCAACHADPHAGQFARQNVTDCARCHSDAGKFTQTTFDHQRDSVFKLDARHAKLACAACHRAVEVTPVLKVIRYRPLGTRCQDCHAAGNPAAKEGQ